ncbi:uncharacterized protein PSFLO_02349 [Pseudozyma flocculosa]|uniref:Uncharacterized protein n=1 Tax=Pseudozyma flocculosa TaxID=84751 RepID=A0A5C3EXD2_9BASI|nr:uncharacterized protein PSFLO_02349 [Pseudozyma flocculosa]
MKPRGWPFPRLDPSMFLAAWLGSACSPLVFLPGLGRRSEAKPDGQAEKNLARGGGARGARPSGGVVPQAGPAFPGWGSGPAATAGHSPSSPTVR